MAPGGRRSPSATHATWWVPPVLVLLVLASLWYGHAPPRTDTAYRRHASDTTAFLHSQLETARLWVEQRPDRVLDSSVVVAIEESETDAGVTLDRFAGYDPPPGSDGLRARVVVLGERATALLADLRIAAHRGDWSRVATLAADAEGPSRRLERLSVEVRPG